MPKFMIRFNQSRGQPNRGTEDHVWRVFEDDKEYLCKNVKINVTSYGLKVGENWNICCEGTMEIDRDTSTIIIH